MADLCIPCWMRMHEECYEPVEADCCCYGKDATDTRDITDPEETERVIRPSNKEDVVLADPISTGRKRAAQLKPIIEGMVCEWANLAFAGGGPVPIVGCRGNVLTKAKGNEELTGNIHHGPDKSTLNNSDQNLHRICGKCHNRWHTLNDPYYSNRRPPNGEEYLPIGVEKESLVQHNKYMLASEDQLTYSEAWWKMPKEVREHVPFRKVETDER